MRRERKGVQVGIRRAGIRFPYKFIGDIDRMKKRNISFWYRC